MRRYASFRAFRKYRYLIAAVLPLLILLSKAVVPFSTFFWGNELLLETFPLDPRDYFRGNYAKLDYAVAHIPLAFLPDDIAEGSRIYVVLEPDHKGVSRFIEASLSEPASGTFLRGRVSRIRVATPPENSVADIDYRIGTYFLPQGEDIEGSIAKTDVFALLRVFKGEAVLLGLKPHL